MHLALLEACNFNARKKAGKVSSQVPVVETGAISVSIPPRIKLLRSARVPSSFILQRVIYETIVKRGDRSELSPSHRKWICGF